jgi:hypothetical protein
LHYDMVNAGMNLCGTDNYPAGSNPGPKRIVAGKPYARRAGWQSVARATVPAGGTRNLILVVKPTGRTGHADGLAIDYQESGQSFRLVISTRLKVRVGASCS